MQYLITGVPGAGKSQRALWRVLNDPRFENRPVSYCNFGELNIGDPRLANWTELKDFKDWFKLPAGTVLIVDEVQSKDILPGRSANSVPPEYVEAFSKSRKLGIDIILVTQHPKNMDLFVRRMMETHEHLTRVGQFEYATVTEYQGYQDVDTKVDESTVISRSRWPYDKTIWTLYKSAELHTVKKKIPRIVYKFAGLLLASVLLIGGGFYYVSSIGKKSPPAIAGAVKAGTGDVEVKVDPYKIARDYTTAAQAYKQSLIPLDAAYPESATIYNEARKVLTFPRMAGCAKMGDRCTCYTQQGTPTPATPELCNENIVVGRFDPYKDERTEKQESARQTLAPRATSADTSLAANVPPAFGRSPGDLGSVGEAGAAGGTYFGSRMNAADSSKPGAAPDIQRGGYLSSVQAPRR